MHGAGCNEKLVAVWQRRKRSMICKNCGANNPDGKLFCSECGARLDDAKVCPNCGAVTNGKFCSDCGYDLRETEKDEKETPEIKSKRKVFGEWFIFAALVLTVLGETYFCIKWVLQFRLILRITESDTLDRVLNIGQSISQSIGNMLIFAGAITALVLFFGKNKTKKKYAFFSAFSVFLFIAKNGSFVSVINNYIGMKYLHGDVSLLYYVRAFIIPTVALVAGILTVLGCVLRCDKFCKNGDKRVFAGCVLCVVGLISVLLLNALMPNKGSIIFFLLCRKIMEHFGLEFVLDNQIKITIYNAIVSSILDGIAILIAFTAYWFMTETRGKAHFVNIILSGQILLSSLSQFLTLNYFIKIMSDSDWRFFYYNPFTVPFIITTTALALIAFLCAVLNFAIRKGVERKTFVRIKK